MDPASTALGPTSLSAFELFFKIYFILVFFMDFYLDGVHAVWEGCGRMCAGT